MGLFRLVPVAAVLLSACAEVVPPSSASAEPSDSEGGDVSSPIIIAHRGYSGIAPEHTIAAYDAAIEAGADYIEQDLQMTADGVLVVLHDATLDRTARGAEGRCTGPVIERTLAELRDCDVGLWFNETRPERAREAYRGARIPTLEEVFERYGSSVRYYIETKNPEEAPGMEEALLDLLQRYELGGDAGGHPRVLIQSFSAESLRKIHSLDPTRPLVLLFGRMPSEEIQAGLADVASYASGIGPHFSSVDAGLVEAAHAVGLVLHPYTVNEETDMRRLAELGVDGFFTDETERALRVLRP